MGAAQAAAQCSSAGPRKWERYGRRWGVYRPARRDPSHHLCHTSHRRRRRRTFGSSGQDAPRPRFRLVQRPSLGQELRISLLVTSPLHRDRLRQRAHRFRVSSAPPTTGESERRTHSPARPPPHAAHARPPARAGPCAAHTWNAALISAAPPEGSVDERKRSSGVCLSPRSLLSACFSTKALRGACEEAMFGWQTRRGGRQAGRQGRRHRRWIPHRGWLPRGLVV